MMHFGSRCEGRDALAETFRVQQECTSFCCRQDQTKQQAACTTIVIIIIAASPACLRKKLGLPCLGTTCLSPYRAAMCAIAFW